MSVREYLLNGPLGFGGAPLGNLPVKAPHLRLRSYWRKVDGLTKKKTVRGSQSIQTHIGVLKELFGQ